MAIEAIVNRVFPDIKNSSSDLEKANDIILDAAHSQLALIRSGRFDRYQGVTDLTLLDTFAQDSLYSNLLEMARNEIREFGSEEDSFMKRFSGALFEELALAHLSSRQDLGGVVISGEELFSAMVALNQGRQIIEHGFNQVGIYGRYVPDALLMGEVEGRISVKGVMEIGLGKWSEKQSKEKQIRGYEYLLRDLGINDPESAPLIIVTPRFESPDSGYNGVKHITVPIENRDFYDELQYFAYALDTRVGKKTLRDYRQDLIDDLGLGAVANPASV